MLSSAIKPPTATLYSTCWSTKTSMRGVSIARLSVDAGGPLLIVWVASTAWGRVMGIPTGPIGRWRYQFRRFSLRGSLSSDRHRDGVTRKQHTWQVLSWRILHAPGQRLKLMRGEGLHLAMLKYIPSQMKLSGMRSSCQEHG